MAKSPERGVAPDRNDGSLTGVDILMSVVGAAWMFIRGLPFPESTGGSVQEQPQPTGSERLKTRSLLQRLTATTLRRSV